jgi:DNA polymerase-3 subunit beta
LKATFPLKPLSEAIKTALGVVPSRTTKDILKSIKLTVTGDVAKITATDSESSIVIYIRGIESQKNGVVLLPAAKLSSIVSEMTSTVSMEEKEGKVTIKSDGAKFVLQTEKPEDFPPTEEFSSEAFITVQGASLKRLLRRTLFCCDPQSTIHTLGGVSFEFDGKRLTLVATDKRRLALDTSDAVPTGAISPVSNSDCVIVTQKSLNALERCLGEDPVDIAFSKNKIAFRTGDVAMSCQTIQGKFPDFRRVVCDSPSHRIDMSAGPFNIALRQVLLVTAEESRGVKFTFSKGTLKLQGSAANIGESEIEIPIGFDGTSVATMDPNYTIAATKLLDSSQPFTLELLEDGEAGVTNRMVIKSGDWQHMQMGLS